jgi:predicted metalloprotease with PDZ domain
VCRGDNLEITEMLSIVRILFLGLILAGTTQPALAQQGGDPAAAPPDEEELARELERAQADMERAVREVERAAADAREGTVDVEIEMRDAESRLSEAAMRVAELSMHRLPMLGGGTWTTEMNDKPVLGITIGARDTGQPVEGVEVLGVTPGGAADEAGIRAGDVITAINGEALSAASVAAANDRLLDFMAGIEEGDELEIEYLRNGKSGTVTVLPRPTPQVFAFGGGRNFTIPFPPTSPGAAQGDFRRYVFISEGGGLGDMEMVRLTEGLGRYFGTDEGMLVVRAPRDTDTYKLQDGDVILDIDGRKPTSVSHAVRILGSYQAGEKLKIRIMRDQRERTLDIEMPEQRTGALSDGDASAAELEALVAPKLAANQPQTRPRRERTD